MELQARVRVWGRPRGRSGTRVPRASSTHCVREDARVGAGSDGGEESDLGATNGEDIYDGVTFERRRVEAMKTARRWRAYWETKIDPATGEELPARMGDVRKMILEAPGLAAGETVEFLVSMDGHTFKRELDGTSGANGANLPYSDWDAPDESPPFRELKSGEPFPVVSYSFSASAGGRIVTSKLPMPYEDNLAVILVFRDDQGNESILSKRRCTVSSPWGRRIGVTDDSGVLRQAGLPPGGINISAGQSILMQTGNVWLDERAGAR